MWFADERDFFKAVLDEPFPFVVENLVSNSFGFPPDFLFLSASKGVN